MKHFDKHKSIGCGADWLDNMLKVRHKNWRTENQSGSSSRKYNIATWGEFYKARESSHYLAKTAYPFHRGRKNSH